MKPSETRISKTSGFRMDPVFEWSDFGSLLYNFRLCHGHLEWSCYETICLIKSHGT